VCPNRRRLDGTMVGGQKNRRTRASWARGNAFTYLSAVNPSIYHRMSYLIRDRGSDYKFTALAQDVVFFARLEGWWWHSQRTRQTQRGDAEAGRPHSSNLPQTSHTACRPLSSCLFFACTPGPWDASGRSQARPHYVETCGTVSCSNLSGKANGKR